LKESETLYVTPEPTNKYDKHAIAVTTESGTSLGYVPKDLARGISLSKRVACTTWMHTGGFELAQSTHRRGKPKIASYGLIVKFVVPGFVQNM